MFFKQFKFQAFFVLFLKSFFQFSQQLPTVATIAHEPMNVHSYSENNSSMYSSNLSFTMPVKNCVGIGATFEIQNIFPCHVLSLEQTAQLWLNVSSSSPREIDSIVLTYNKESSVDEWLLSHAWKIDCRAFIGKTFFVLLWSKSWQALMKVDLSSNVNWKSELVNLYLEINNSPLIIIKRHE